MFPLSGSADSFARSAAVLEDNGQCGNSAGHSQHRIAASHLGYSWCGSLFVLLQPKSHGSVDSSVIPLAAVVAGGRASALFERSHELLDHVGRDGVSRHAQARGRC